MDDLNFIFVINLAQVDMICDEFMRTSVFLSSLLVMPRLGLAPRCPTFLLSAHFSPHTITSPSLGKRIWKVGTQLPATDNSASRELGLMLSDKPLLAWLALPAPVLGLPRSAL